MGFDEQQGRKALDSIINEFAIFKKEKLVSSSVLLSTFFNTKAQELGSIFNGWSNPDLFRNLMYLDPTNSTIYDDSKDGKYQ